MKSNKVVVGWKGFNSDMTCNNYKFEVGKEYEEKEAKICSKGFHFCTNPLDVLSYYSIADDGTFSKFAKVEASRSFDSKKNEDSKVCSTKIKIVAELSFSDFVKESISLLFNSIKKSSKNASSGYNAKNASSGDYAKNASSGNNAKNASSGNYAKNASSGNYGSIEVKGKNSVGVCAGKETIVSGLIGSWFGLTSYDTQGNPNGGKFIHIDGKKYKENTKYKMINNKIVEVR